MKTLKGRPGSGNSRYSAKASTSGTMAVSSEPPPLSGVDGAGVEKSMLPGLVIAGPI